MIQCCLRSDGSQCYSELQLFADVWSKFEKRISGQKWLIVVYSGLKSFSSSSSAAENSQQNVSAGCAETVKKGQVPKGCAGHGRGHLRKGKATSHHQGFTLVSLVMMKTLENVGKRWFGS